MRQEKNIFGISLIFCFILIVINGCQNHSGSSYDRPHYRITFDKAGCLVEIYDEKLTRPLFQYEIYRPFRRYAITSATQLGFLSALGKSGNIVASTTPRKMYNRDGWIDRVYDIGEDTNLDIEQLLLSGADILFATWYGKRISGEELLREAGVEVVYFLEWRETDPVCRASWIEVMGAFTGESERADSIMRAVRSTYENTVDSLRQLSREVVTVLSGSSYNGVWYLPGGNTYMGKLFRDAGVGYKYSQDKRNISIPLSIERVIREFSDADVWIGANAHTYEELYSFDKRFVWFDACKNNRTFNSFKRSLSTGANDYWETGVIHPEYILNDIVSATYSYPNEYEMYFFNPLVP